MKILVTGCAGFIGYHITQKLLSCGHSVIGIDNLNDYYSPALKTSRLTQLGINIFDIKQNIPVYGKNNLCFIQADINDTSLYPTILKNEKIEVICHLAAQAGVRYSIENPQQYISSNINGFFNIIEYCRANPETKLVFASSSSVYGNNTSVPYKETDITDTPVSLYAATKKANELIAHSYSALYGINIIGLRFFTAYGPWGRPDMAPFLFTEAILNDRKLKLFNNGNMSRDFTFIDDITEGIYKVLLNNPDSTSGPLFRIYNIGNSTPVQLEDFISTIEQITKKKAQKVYETMQPGDVKDTWADTSLLRRDYGYAPTTSINTGLAAFIQWYEDYYLRGLYDNKNG
ncbi:MAG: NAD-dependent epimerase/dehydratase family protein [Bacteroidales bacterium]|jgi:UDP-glucuronate 4-epimerase|nr:NAD-dependent epimerase/dehydratase family protein [Bacteroidales bacterium]